MALTTGIVSYWKLDESSGNAADSAGSNTATNNSVTYGAGKINNGAVFNASANFTDSATGFPTGTTSRTVNIWWKTNALPGGVNDYAMFYWGVNSSGQMNLCFLGWNETANMLGYHGNGADYRVDVDGLVTTGVWYMATFVYDGTQAHIYHNGSQIGTGGNVTWNTGSGNGEIGSGQGGGNKWNGMLDEIGIWSRVLSDTEITELYNAGAGLQYPFGESETVPSLTLLGVGV